MKKPRFQKARGDIFDVQEISSKTSAIHKALKPILSPHLVNLRPKFHKKHPWLSLLVIVLLIIFVSAGVRQLLTRAEVADFYSSICLGTWQNTANAQGKPETFGASSSIFSKDNSAVYKGGATQIFCGGFLPPDFKTEGNIKNVGLTLVWQVGETSSTNSSSGTTAATSTLNVATTTTKAASSSPEAAPQLPSSTQATTTSSFLNPFLKFFNIAFADDSSSTPTASSSVPAPANETTTPAQVPAQTTSTAEPAAQSTSSAPSTKPSPSIDTKNSTATSTAIVASQSLSTSTPTSTVKISTSTSPAGPEQVASTSVPAAQPPAADENFLKISYSTDGQTWVELSKISPENWQNFTATLPVNNWSDIQKLQIKIEGIPTSLQLIPETYLDGMFIEVHYDLPPALPLISENSTSTNSPASQNNPFPTTPVIVLPPEQKPVPVNPNSSFKSDEAPTFDFDLNSLPAPTSTSATSTPPDSNAPLPSVQPPATSTPSSTSAFIPIHNLASFFLRITGLEKLVASAQSAPDSTSNLPTAVNPIVAQIFGPDGKLTGFQPVVLTANNKLRITLPEPGRHFQPGSYALKLWIWKQDTIYFTESDFSWGVFVINFNKSIYKTGDIAEIGFGLLTRQGHTVCNGDITLNISSPTGKVYHFSTADSPSKISGGNLGGQAISRNPTCGPQTVTNEPDYSASFKVSEAGVYNVSAVALDNITGNRISLTDKFEIQSRPLFDVERVEATRIYPPAIYKATLKIIPSVNYSGNITEVVPDSFSVIPETAASKSFSGGDQIISWNVNLKSGEETDLSYFFQAPNISPELYKLGPLAIGSWQEARQWQIAADAAGDVILMWEGTSADVPSGWTCINCATTDPFYGVFPRASSTYATASSSADTESHADTFVSATTGAGAGFTWPSGTTFPGISHTHTWPNFTTSADDIRPPFKNLLFIKANAPASLPAGIIGMFDVAATSSLPLGWTSYDTLNVSSTNIYLRGGENTTSTGGTATHQHTVPSTQTSGGGNNALAAGGTSPGKAHCAPSCTHTLAAGSVAANATSSNPSFATIVFGKLSSAGSVPTGLVAFFDNTSLPTNWNRITTSSVSGASFLGNLLVGSSTAGTTGGRNFHTHDNTIITSTADTGGTTDKRGTGTDAAGSGHTHNVTYSIASSTENSLPVYRDVILGKFAAPANSPPTVSAVVLNSATAITLNPNVTTTITAVASTTDPDGAGDIRYATSTIYRSGVAATCTASNLNCYQIASSSCSFTDATSTVKCSADIWYFAQATDASSSFSSQNWLAAITVHDSVDNTDTSTTASGVKLNTLLAINITTSSVNYGTVLPSADTGSTNQTSTVQNAGNASTTLKLSGTALTLNTNSIATSSQHYATSTFTFGGAEQALSDVAAAVSGFLLTSPTSTAAVQSNIFWGITVPAGSATGTYTGTNTFTAVFSP